MRARQADATHPTATMCHCMSKVSCTTPLDVLCCVLRVTKNCVWQKKALRRPRDLHGSKKRTSKVTLDQLIGYCMALGTILTCIQMTEDGLPAKESRIRRYRPLDVVSWRQGLLVVLGWLLVPAFAMLSTVLFYMYEMKYINISDRDLRDLYMDQRLNTQSSDYTHHFFVDALTCCNPDPVVFKENSWECDDVCDQNRDNAYGILLSRCDAAWPCPPLIMIQCPYDLVSSQCNQARGMLYPLVGLSNITGEYTNCSTGGRVRVGSMLVDPAEPLTLRLTYDGKIIGQLTVTNMTTPADIQTLVDVALRYSSTEYVNPNIRLQRAVALAGQPINSIQIQSSGSVGNKKRINPWPMAIFNWPGAFRGGNRCRNTSTGTIWYLSGSVTVAVPPFDYNNPTTAITNITVYNDRIQTAFWKVASLPASNKVGQLSDQVSVQVLTAVWVYVGMMRDIGACNAWMIDESEWGTNFTYTEAWRGPFRELLNNNNITELQGHVRTIDVQVQDTAAPMRTQLPFYGGMWYIVMCFAMAAIWTFSLGPFIVFGIPLIWWNVRSNKGLAPVVYRYMKKYRGW